MIRKLAKTGKPITWFLQVIIILFSFAHSIQGKDFAHKKLEGVKVAVSDSHEGASFENYTRSNKDNSETSVQVNSILENVFVHSYAEDFLLEKPFIEINFYERNFFYVYNSQSAP